MRRVSRVPVSCRTRYHSCQRVLQPTLAEEREVGLLHRHVNKLTLAGAVAVVKRQRKGTKTEQPGNSIWIHLT